MPYSRSSQENDTVPESDIEEQQQERLPLLSSAVTARHATHTAGAAACEQPSSTPSGDVPAVVVKVSAGAVSSPKFPGKCKAMSPLHRSASTASLGGDIGVCRICLEDDTLSSLESPCACTGTQMYAHHACIQKWVNEKHTIRCEICDTDYKGSYAVPPLPQLSCPDTLPLVTPLGSLYLTIAADPENLHHSGRHGGLLDPWEDELEDEQPPTLSWCASLLIFLLFMMVLHHSMVITVPGQQDPNAAAAAARAGAAAAAPSAWAPGAAAAAGAAFWSSAPPGTSAAAAGSDSVVAAFASPPP